MKKLSVGFFLTVLSAILAVVGLIFYMVNANTAYFANLGVNAAIVGCAVAAIVLQAIYLGAAARNERHWALGFCPIVACALLMLAFTNFITARVNGIASIMTFENNASNMADLTSALVGLVFCLLAVVFGIVSAFFDVSKDR